MALARGLTNLLLIIALGSNNVNCKIYERCELARELRNFDMPDEEVPTWVCIAKYESNFNTGAMNFGSGDHGLFQISEIYWCSPPGYGCNSPCSKFRDEDIADDLQCIRRIHNEHTRISGDGFDAWVVYPLYCKNITTDYIQDCFDENELYNSTTIIGDNEISTDEDEDGYSFPDLPKPYGDGYEFPKLPTREQKALLPFSKTSSKKAHYDFPKFAANKNSIHHSVSVQSKHIKQEKKFDFRKFPGSKGSIYDSISVEDRLIKRIKINPFLSNKISFGEHLSKTISNNDIKANPFLNGKFSISKVAKSLETNPFLNFHKHGEFVSNSQPLHDIKSTLDNEIKAGKEANQLIKAPPISGTIYSGNPFLSGYLSGTITRASSTTKPFTTRNSFETAVSASVSPIASLDFQISTTKPQISNRGPFGVDSRPFDSSKVFSGTTSKPSTTTVIRTSTATTQKPSTTTIRKFTARKLIEYSSSTTPSSTQFSTIHEATSKSQLRSSSTTRAKFVAISANLSSSTFRPTSVHSYAKTSTSASKPTASRKFEYSSSFTTPSSTQSSTEASTIHKATFKSQLTSSSTTKTKIAATIKPSVITASSTFTLTSVHSYAKTSTSASKPTASRKLEYSSSFTPSSTEASTITRTKFATTIKPSARQVTFAPDSWFNWLFSSQTLPPLVGPPRPGSRPVNEDRPPLRPPPGGSTTRRPIDSSTTPTNVTTRRPLPRPTHFSTRPSPGVDVITTRRPSNAPGVDFGPTRRPFPRPPHQQSDMDRFTRRPMPPRRHPGHLRNDGGYKEVAIDEHVVYLRSKYGFQLFRV